MKFKARMYVNARGISNYAVKKIINDCYGSFSKYIVYNFTRSFGGKYVLNIYSPRPGIVIGKYGSDIAALRDTLKGICPMIRKVRVFEVNDV